MYFIIISLQVLTDIMRNEQEVGRYLQAINFWESRPGLSSGVPDKNLCENQGTNLCHKLNRTGIEDYRR